MTKQYFVDQYAHVLKALALGKPIYSRDSTRQSPEDLLQIIYLGVDDPADFTTEPPRLEIAIDTPVWVKFCGEWFPKHFAGYSENGEPMYWLNGLTSHSAVTDGYPSKRTCSALSLTNPKGA